MSQYATIDDVKLWGLMPPADVDALEAQWPGKVDAQCIAVSGDFDSFMIKRYAVPWPAPFPTSLVANVVRAVVLNLYMMRGFDPESKQDAIIQKQSDDAYAWIKAEVANPQSGLSELFAARAEASARSSVVSGGPLSASDPDPYTWMDRQASNARRRFW